MRRLYLACALACCLASASCDTLDFAGLFLVTDTTVDSRFDTSMKILETNRVADVDASSDEYAFYLVTDIHFDGRDDRLERFVSACTADSGSAKAVICLGDIINGRDYQEAVHSRLQPLADAGWRFLNALGNHDTFFGQTDVFRKYWPLTTYSFKVNVPGGKSDLFLCLDSAEGSFGVRQRAWVEEQLMAAAGHYRNIYVLTHTNFFNTDNTQLTSGNYSLEESYDMMSLFAKYDVTGVLTGHDHYFEQCSFRGVSYYTFNALCNKVGSYYKVTFGDDLKLAEFHLE